MDVVGVDVHHLVVDGVFSLHGHVEGLLAPAVGHVVVVGILVDGSLSPYFPGLGGNLTAQKHLDVLDAWLDSRHVGIAVEILGVGCTMSVNTP